MTNSIYGIRMSPFQGFGSRYSLLRRALPYVVDCKAFSLLVYALKENGRTMDFRQIDFQPLFVCPERATSIRIGQRPIIGKDR
jgi:hypothetical protein